MKNMNGYFALLSVLGIISLVTFLVAMCISFVVGTAIVFLIITWTAGRIGMPRIKMEGLEDEHLKLYRELVREYPIDYWIG